MLLVLAVFDFPVVDREENARLLLVEGGFKCFTRAKNIS